MANVLVGRRVVQSKQISCGAASVFPVKAGQLVQIIDMTGGQVAAFVGWGGEDGAECVNPISTMTINASVVLKKDDKLYSGNRTELFEVIEDTVGRHDMLTGAIPAPPPATSTQTVVKSNLEVLQHASGDAPDGSVSSPINFFKHVIIKAKGELEVKDSFSERSDHVVLRVLTDGAVLVGNQFQERRPGVTNGKAATEKDGTLLVRVYA